MDKRAEYPYSDRAPPQQRRRQRARAHRDRTQQQGRDRSANHERQHAARAKHRCPCHHSLEGFSAIRFQVIRIRRHLLTEAGRRL